MGLFSFFNQFNNTSDIKDVENNLTHNLKKNKDKQISYENLCCSNIPKDLRNLFFEFFTNFIKETTSKTSSVNSHISLQNFTEILIHRYDLPFFIPIVSFIYINRILRIPNATAILSEFTPNRLTAVAIIIASKYYLEDTIYIKNSKWISKVCMGLFKTGELNSLESLFLRSIDYHINVSYLEWKEYLERIDIGLHELKLKYNKLSGKELKNVNNINSDNNSNNNLNNSNNLKNNNISSIIQPHKKENPIKNVKQLFSLLDSHILNDNQLISYDPSLEPNFSVLYNLFESPSNSTFSSPQPNYIHNSEIQKIKENIDVVSQSIQNNNNASSSSYNDKVMEEDEPILEGNRKKRTRIKRKNQNYQYSGILTPPSSSSSSSSQSIYASKANKNNLDVAISNCEDEEEKNGNPSSDIEGFSNNSNTLTTEITMNSSLSSSHHQSSHANHASHVNIDINTSTNSGLNFNNLKDKQSTIFTPNSQLKINTLSSLYQHNPDLKNALENYSITGRLTAGHSNHYAGNRYHPFSRQNRNVPTEEKRNGLPLFSPIKTIDKPMTAVSSYVYSLLNKHSMTKSYNKNNSSENSDDQSDMFVSPIPNGNIRSNTIRSFNIHDSDDEKMKKNPNQMSVEDIASKYSISKSKNTREYNCNNSNNNNDNNNNNNNKDRFHKTSGRTSLSYTSRNRKHRRSLSTNKTTTTSSPNSSFTSSTQRSNTNNFSDSNIINLGLGISKKSKLISKNTKINIPKTKNQKLITSYLTTMMESQPESQSHQIPSTHSTTKIANPNITFLKRFPSITKLLNKFNVRKEKKNIS